MTNPEDLLSRKELSDKFGWEEYLMFSLVLAISAVMGIFFWWKGQENSAEFLLGGKKLGTVPVTLSLTAR